MPKLWISKNLRILSSGRRAFHTGRRQTERTVGLYGSDYAGMSSDKRGENPLRRKPKVSWGR